MDPNFIPLKAAAKEAHITYFRAWRMVVAGQVPALRVRKPGARKILWLVNLSELKRILQEPPQEIEIVEIAKS